MSKPGGLRQVDVITRRSDTGNSYTVIVQRKRRTDNTSLARVYINVGRASLLRLDKYLRANAYFVSGCNAVSDAFSEYRIAYVVLGSEGERHE